ncbi:hypothetical protein EXIGLDRAFT_626428, partial [Exidia glandulosa HHB12029]
WGELLPQVVDAFLAWKHRGARENVPDDRDVNNAPGPDNDAPRDFRIVQAPDEHPALSVVRAGLMPCSPLQPSVAISMGILELYYRVRSHAPRLGVQLFVRGLCDKYMVRLTVSNIFCLTDFGGQLQDEPPLEIDGQAAMDGGTAMKRSASAGHADTRVFETDYRIPPAEVDVYANEVKKRVMPTKAVSRDLKKQVSEVDASSWTTLNEPGEPGDDAPKPSVCAGRWKNAKAEHHKTAPGMYDQTGVFVCVCRHGLVLWFAEMVRSGKLAKYPLSIIARMIASGMRCKDCGYDIGCAFQGTLERSALLGDAARDAAIKCGVNSFHGYGHNRLCQLGGHPLFRRGFGLEDLETCERFFSTCISDSQASADIVPGRFLYNNVVQAERLIQELEPVVKSFQQRTGISDEEIEGWRVAEKEYLEGLKAEPEQVGLVMDYITLLGDLSDAEYAVLGIDVRWTTESREYQDALASMAERDWRRALDKLELLMVQRMFELAKTHTFGTGMRYKLRQAIGKGLKSRSQAIRAAVQKYNTLAETLNPPAPTKPWANATNRLMASNPLLACELEVYAMRRMAVNTVHRDRLARLGVHAGFGPSLVPGIRLGREAPPASNDVQMGDARAIPVVERPDHVQDDLDAVDAEVEEELGRLHDFLADLE